MEVGSIKILKKAVGSTCIVSVKDENKKQLLEAPRIQSLSWETPRQVVHAYIIYLKNEN